jgi:signal transduction histidine kinase
MEPGPTRRALLVDVGVAVLVGALGLAELTGVVPGSTFPGDPVVNTVFVLLTAAALVTRRILPMTTFLAVVTVTTVWQYSLYGVEQQMPFEPFVALLIAVFGAGALTSGRTAAAALATVGVGVVLGVVDLLSGKPWGTAVPPLLMIIGVFLLGRLVAVYRLHAHESAVRAVRAEQQSEDARRQAVVDERARIARELHDVISHDVSLMVLQASVERRLIGEAGPAAGGGGAAAAPDGAAATTSDVLASIEATGRDALAELRHMLGVLRQDGAAPLEPQPGLSRLDELVAQAREAGIDVHVERDGESLALPSGLDLAAYRVVQEALTNVAKHVGPTQVRLALTHRPDLLVIEVVDQGPARPSGIPGGHGLVGMRERVSLYGGTLVTEPYEQGFRVLAHLPVAVPS